MKIDNSTKNLNGIPITDPQTSTNKVTGKSESVPETDSVQISSQVSASQSNEVFDSSKVDAIKQAISSGQFAVDTGKVADGLINTVKDLLKPN